MRYSPSNNPTLCQGNIITISDTVRSYYNTYNHYKWQRSTDGGATWTDISGASGVGSPVWNGSSWQYVTAYTITPAYTQLSNAGDQYRVVVGTTAANMLNTNCNFTDGIAIITLNVIDCGPPLDVSLVSFKGKVQNGKAGLTWATTRESEPVSFEVERSVDGRSFFHIGKINGANNPAVSSNQYLFVDSTLVTARTFYRIILQTAGGRRIASHTIQLKGEVEDFNIQNLVNPFTKTVSFDAIVGEGGYA
jgi:hypothetical protein